MDAIEPRAWAEALKDFLVWFNSFLGTPVGVLCIIAIAAGLFIAIMKNWPRNRGV